MNYTTKILTLLTILIASSCQTNVKLVGLWQIDKVKVGSQEMTPVARWTRINKDNTQESGNGWQQHSIGSWEYSQKEKQIDLVNYNGLKDEFGGFSVLTTTKEEMIWQRKEEGENVEITFKRIEKIPQAPSNKILGVWKLKNISKTKIQPYLFFRWDHILINRKDESGKKYGMYKTHGHKQELQIIYYEDPLRQESWNYKFSKDNSLVLESTSKEFKAVFEYERINYIPE